jgi:hypothetical protein
MKVSVGSVLKGFTVHRLDGSVERYDTPIHNYMRPDFDNGQAFLGNGTTNASLGTVRYLGLCEHRASSRLFGIGGGNLAWNQSTRTLSNVDVFNNSGGSEAANSALYVLDSGEWAYSQSSNISSGSVILSNDSFGVSIAGKRVYQFCAGTTSTDRASNASATARSASYSNGVITSVNTQPQVVTLSANRTIRSLRFANGTAAAQTSAFNIFDLPTPLNLLAGETVSVLPNDFVTTFTFDDYRPRVFTAPNCPIAGISASGRYQRLLPAFGTSLAATKAYENAIAGSDLRIWLISDANKMTIPNFTGNILADETYIVAPIETITPIYLSTPASTSNDFTDTLEILGSVQTGGLVKQIIAGRTATNEPLGWVIEFDTPQEIPAGKVLYFKTQLQITQDVVVPTYLTNP